MRSVLLPIDGSDSAFQAARYVIDFVKQYGALAIHVANIQPKPFEWATRGMEPETVEENPSVQAHVALKPVLHALDEEGIVYQTHVRFGDTGEALLALADELECDHIIMGPRGLGAISGLMLGSVTLKVLHLAKIPVICVKNDRC
ncbi:MAG: universal stress protein [Sulfuritalea sp.]|jgi:nucleotide-binding universal stress UspA family protein|nr:universal stress protein [Sulfuritalea sp.]